MYVDRWRCIIPCDASGAARRGVSSRVTGDYFSVTFISWHIPLSAHESASNKMSYMKIFDALFSC